MCVLPRHLTYAIELGRAGLSRRQIARQMHVSCATAKKYIQRARKLAGSPGRSTKGPRPRLHAVPLSATDV